ncbi:MAG: (d)CMP kinase [Nitrospirae bacterium]|nr:(d)CMP kinase [Nitrospirota bacterium]MBI3593407.1 (d)CMP kinase [Nitrospirota bacterium]
MDKKIAIAIDGPSASGKTTAAKLLAKRLGYRYLDTGLLYRALAWKVMKEKIDPLKEDEVSRLCRLKPVRLEESDHRYRIRIEGVDVTEELKTPELSKVSSLISKYKAVRESLIQLQREVGKEAGVILVGRDIGTQILPDAPVKFFMDASIEVRGKRRYEELVNRGFKSELAETIREMSQRDQQDRDRAISPMQAAPDSVYLDTSGDSLEVVVEKMLAEVNRQIS